MACNQMLLKLLSYRIPRRSLERDSTRAMSELQTKHQTESSFRNYCSISSGEQEVRNAVRPLFSL